MSDRITRIVRAPYDDTARFLTAFLGHHRSSDGSACIALRLPNAIFAERRSAIERRLWASVYPLHAASDREHVYSVTWSLRFVGAFPEFNGALAIELGESDDACSLYVTGNYELLPYAGKADVTLFRRVAHASARELLRTIAEHVENACAHDFAARAGYSKPMQFAMLSTTHAHPSAIAT
jgi:hypothetical protein